VSDRKTDDLAMYRCVVIVTKPDDGPSHLIYAPDNENVWVVLSVGKGPKPQTFPALRTALNFVRPVLGKIGSDQPADTIEVV